MIRSKKIDRYMLELMTRPVVGCLAVTLTSLLLERILRLFNELAQNGADFGFVLQITVNLVPQYLTLALPASFFVSIFIVIARLGDDNEIDAILASGVSISRLSAPFIGLGLAFTLVSLVLFGFLQPYGRYAYLQVLNMAIHAGWSAQLQPQVFVDPGHGLTITADEVGMSGRKLHGVFVRQVSADGRERISTAHEGELTTSVDKTMVELHMDKGIQLDRMPGQPGKILQFQNVTVAEPMGDMGGKIAPRGGDVRELTLLELVRELRHKNSVLPHTALRSELYGRLVRTLSVPFLPLLAIPLGMAAKRGRRAPGLILAGALMISFHHAVQTVESLGRAGHINPGPPIWTIYFVFTGLCTWLFLSSLRRPGDTPLSRFVGGLGDAVHWLRELFGHEPVGATP